MFARPGIRRKFLLAVLLLAVCGLAYVFVILPALPGLAGPQLEVGQVAPQDYIAPRSFSFESEVQTEQQRQAAAAQIQPVFTAPDTAVARQQVNSLREALAFITAIRSDLFATPEQKVADLAALESIKLRQETAQKLLVLSDARWQALQQETINVLEQTMRNTIREDRVEDARRLVPTRVSLALPEDQAAIVSELAEAFVAPNSFFSPELTDAARQQAQDAIQPVNRSFLAGETIVQRGRVITQSEIEALLEAGLLEGSTPWQEHAGTLAIILVTATFSVMYLNRRVNITDDLRSLLLIAILFLVFLGAARLLIPGHVVMPYLFPVTAFSLTLAALFGVQPAVILTLPLVVLITFGQPNALELTLYYLFSAFFGIFSLGHGRRISAFLRASLTSAFAGMVIIVAYRLTQGDTDWIGILTLAGAALFNGAVSAGLTVVLQFFLAQFLGMTTQLQLMELSRPDHPLLQFILRRAPGTYQHSLQVANLAEQAAERIHADALLTRVGALYHDSGKALNPTFFIENQLDPSHNPHDDLDPETSAAIIIRHVTDGQELARKHRLPQRIRDFINEHHGDSITRYQYIKALDAVDGDENQIDVSHFQYPGPKPQSRETAILMLADSSEAVTRSKIPKSEAELREIVKSVIESRLAEGQLDDTSLTIRDLNEILDSFTGTLKGVYHPRIEYPRLKEATPVELPEPGVSEALPALHPTNPQSFSEEVHQEHHASASDVPTRPADSANMPTLPSKTQADSSG
jgi:cyclic-di-AMP phosphodiesterase PgpH